MTLDYLADEFIRRDCGIHGAEFSGEDCQRIREEVFLLHSKGEFHHTYFYWIANRLAKESRNSATISFKENLKMSATLAQMEEKTVYSLVAVLTNGTKPIIKVRTIQFLAFSFD